MAARWDDVAVAHWRRAWSSTLVIRLALLAAVILGAVWGVLRDTAPCSVAHPEECGADPVGAVFFGLLGGFVVLLAWSAQIACVVLAVASLVDALLDPTVEVRPVFAVIGVLALAGLLALRRAEAATREQGARGAVTTAVARPGASARAWLWPFGPLAVVAAIVAVAATGWWAVQDAQDRAHRSEGSRVVVTVVDAKETDDDTVIDVRDPAGDRYRFSVLDLSTYPVGSTTVVTVDGSWRELVAEEHDPTGWLALGVLAGALAVGAGAGLRARRSDLNALTSGGPVTSRIAALDPAEPGWLTLRAVDGDGRVLARLRPLGDAVEGGDGGDFVTRWREQGPDAAVTSPATVAVTGVLTPGAVVAFEAAEASGLAVVHGPSLDPRRLFTSRRMSRDADVISSLGAAPVLPGTAARSGGPAPLLPYVVRPSARSRGLWTLLLVAVVVGAPVLTWWVADDWPTRLIATGVAAQTAASAAAGATRQLVADHAALRLRSFVGTLTVPWSQVAGFRSEVRTVFIADVDGGVEQFGPLNSSDGDAAEVAARLTAVLERGLAAGPTDARTRRRVGPSFVAAAVVVVLQVGAVALQLR